MLASYPTQGWPAQAQPHLHLDPADEQDLYNNSQYQFQFHFDSHKQQQQQQQQHAHPVPAPPKPLIPDDNGFAFSHYIAHDTDRHQQQQPSTPSTPPLSSTYSVSSLSSASPFSAVTGAFPMFHSQQPVASSYSELQGMSTYFPAPPLAQTPVVPAPALQLQPQPQPSSSTQQRQYAPVPKRRPVVDVAAAHDEPKREKPDTKRPSGACTRCKKMKMKCEFRPSDATCQRCKAGQYDCVVEGRKPRTPSQREWLLSQIRSKDAMIATLLKAYRPHSDITPITLASGKLDLLPAERAAHREALNWAEKGAPAVAPGASQRYRMRYKDRAKEKTKEREREGNEDEDEEWSSEESDASEDAWDGAVEEAFTREGVATGAGMYAHALPEADAPFGMIARLSLGVARGEEEQAEAVGVKRGAEKMLEEAEKAGDEEEQWGIASRTYFQPGPAANLALRRVLNEREMPPAIIASGLISWQEAEQLFDIFYKRINPFVSLLDPVIHTVSSVFERCPFLFTVVCAISLRYFPSRPGIHKVAMHFAKTAAGTAFVDGFKSVELVQGYFLLSVYGLPARRWEEDRSWFYGGLASRIATDLSLNRATATKPLSERHERELLNRVRTWLIVFNVDRSSSTQFGKPSGLQEDDVIRNAKEWYRRSKYNHAYDVHLVAYTELLRIMSRFHAQVYSDARTPNGLNKSCDFRAITEATEAEIRVWHDDQDWKYANESDPNDPGCVFRAKGRPMFENYMKLVMYSFGFQDAWKRHGVEPGDMFFAKCLSAASAVVRQLNDVYAPSGFLKYAPDCYFVMGGFCSAFLLKMLRPEFAALLDEEQRTRIVSLVERFVEVLMSPDASIDETHTPNLYARFLHGQLKHVRRAGRTPAEAEGASAAIGLGLASPVSQPTDSHRATPELSSDGPPLFSHSTPGGHSSSSGSSVPTPGPENESGWPDSWTEGEGSTTGSAGSATAGPRDDPMELCEEDYLATMQAVSSEQWLNSLLMPGYKWPVEEPVQAQDGFGYGFGFGFPGQTT